MANKHIGPNDKDVAEQHVASIGAFQVDLQSWASNSVCLKIRLFSLSVRKCAIDLIEILARNPSSAFVLP